MARGLATPSPDVASQIINIRTDSVLTPLDDQIHAGLKQPGEKRLPTLLLYDEKGLKLFEKITYLEEYYLTEQEIEVLTNNAAQIAERVALQPGSMVVELGSGNLRKVKILLDALDRVCTDVSYYALDLSQEELERTLADVPEGAFKNIKCFGLLGTYDDGLVWLKEPKNAARPKLILSLGSSIGNFSRSEGAAFLSGFGKMLGPHDAMLVGIDGCDDAQRVYHAYNDREGVTHDFISNGLRHANRVLGTETFHLPDWKVVGEFDQEAGRHHVFVVPSKDVKVKDVTIRAGERVRIEESYKYSAAQRKKLWSTAGLDEDTRWCNARDDYGEFPRFGTRSSK